MEPGIRNTFGGNEPGRIPPVFICMQIKEIGSCYLFDLVSLF